MRWLDNKIEDKIYMIQRIVDLKNIDAESVEKDWWVTAVLKVLFGMSMAKYMYFKGGTSLSKGWNLIDRFSEDIDIALYRDFFAEVQHKECAKCQNNNQIKYLRIASRDFVTGEFKDEFEKRLLADGLDVVVEAVTEQMTPGDLKPIDHDSDPTVINVYYPSIYAGNNDYVRPAVKIEISCLTMPEPFEVKTMKSLIGDEFVGEDDDTNCEIATISPSRTFLEKAFLLSEEYQRKNPRTIRMSRHLYDLERLMDTEYAESALGDFELYKRIVEHRRKFYHVGGVNYDLDFPATIMFCPVGEMREKIGEDYKKMCSSFIYGKPLDFDKLMERLETLQNRFRKIDAGLSNL